MIQRILNNPHEVAIAASLHAAVLVREAITERGVARVVAATGKSQLTFLDRLIADPYIDWSKVALFHLDEYVGVPPHHPASMHRYIQERIVKPAGIVQSYLLDGTHPETWSHAAAALASAPSDVTFTGLGENGHLAFNEPPADFATEVPFIVVTLAEQTRRRRIVDGEFGSLENVPRQAITMSIRQILKSRAILCIATGKSKAQAARQCLAAQVNPLAPASALQLHPRATVYLDTKAAALLSER